MSDLISENADLNKLLSDKKEQLKKIDFTNQPLSYWGPRNIKSFLLSKIKGEKRRQHLKKIIEEYGEDNLPDISLLKEKLTEDERDLFGKIHPMFMGGEYLPDTSENEVEIARLIMKSTTQDIYSFRARKTKNKIIYSIEDEYESMFELSIQTSKLPLTLKQMIKLISESVYADGMSVYGSAREFNYENSDPWSPEELWDFETIESSFYNELENYYDIQNFIWLIEKRINIQE